MKRLIIFYYFLCEVFVQFVKSLRLFVFIFVFVPENVIKK